jgi:hypothetical protein
MKRQPRRLASFAVGLQGLDRVLLKLLTLFGVNQRIGRRDRPCIVRRAKNFENCTAAMSGCHTSHCGTSEVSSLHLQSRQLTIA